MPRSINAAVSTVAKTVEKCPQCDGDGLFSDDRYEKHAHFENCATCQGTGLVTKIVNTTYESYVPYKVRALKAS